MLNAAGVVITASPRVDRCWKILAVQNTSAPETNALYPETCCFSRVSGRGQCYAFSVHALLMRPTTPNVYTGSHIKVGTKKSSALSCSADHTPPHGHSFRRDLHASWRELPQATLLQQNFTDVVIYVELRSQKQVSLVSIDRSLFALPVVFSEVGGFAGSQLTC